MEITDGTDPFVLFQNWIDEAVKTEINDPDAIALASVAASGMPSVRMVLLRRWSPDGFLFLTNYESRKSDELLATGKAAFCIHWKSQRRQVRVVGDITKATAAQSDEYFHSRGRGSQIGAWAVRLITVCCLFRLILSGRATRSASLALSSLPIADSR